MEILRRVKLRLDRCHDGLGDLVLHREYVGQVAVVAFGPEMAAGDDIVELGGDAHPVAGLAHAAFHYVAHAEISATCFRWTALPL